MTPMLVYLRWCCKYDGLNGSKYWWAMQTVLLPVALLMVVAQVAWENLFS